ncbi:hypothetical protein RB597_008019 [Gaeumannomyces tritici]
METERQLGVTPPVSVSLPSEFELQATDALLAELRAQNSFESPLETEKRHRVLASLQTIADAFVKVVAKEREPHNAVLIKDARAKVFAYGSLRLGVWGPGSDIDTLVVGPRYVTREDYFQHFPDLLVKMAPPGAITDLTVVEEAFVPIIKFEYHGISIDLIFSRIATLKQLPSDPAWGLKDDNLLRGLDEKELRSVNGTRVTDEILSLVPEQNIFRTALRAIKLWAQRRAIYGNIMGFPGGVAWAMLVARVCQLYPKATSSVIVNKFFSILLQWPWPQPVLLKPIGDGPLQVRVWNPRVYKGDSYHLMPVITPAYPSMCATFNVTRSSMTVIKRELQLAAEITNNIMCSTKPWKDMFAKHTFFTKDFKYYMQVISASRDKEAHKIWSGFVESKVRMLVQSLERHESIAVARPFIKGFERFHRYRNGEQFAQILDGNLQHVIKEGGGASPSPDEMQVKKANEPSVKTEDGNKVKQENGEVPVKQETAVKVKDEKPEEVPMASFPEHQPIEANADAKADDGALEMYTTTHYIGLELTPAAKSLDLSFQVNDFKALCHEWEKYKNELSDRCYVNIKDLRNVALPDDLFEPGDVKPAKPIKRRPAAGTNAIGDKKRPANEVRRRNCPACGPRQTGHEEWNLDYQIPQKPFLKPIFPRPRRIGLLTPIVDDADTIPRITQTQRSEGRQPLSPPPANYRTNHTPLNGMACGGSYTSCLGDVPFPN